MADHIDDPGKAGVPEGDHRRPRWVSVAAVAILVLLVAGLVAVLLMSRDDDGSVSTSPSSETTVSPSTTAPAPTTAAAPTAADTLAEFFTAAQRMDAEVSAAAALVNEGTTDVLILDDDTMAAIRALPDAPGYLLPAGLPTKLLEKVLLVQSDLQSRALALIGLGQFRSAPPTPGTIPLDSDAGRGALACLGNGAEAAASFDADLDAAEVTARTLPPVVAQAPDSRAAEELALRLAMIGLGNTGCAGCGGFRATTLAAISWTPPAIESPTGPWDGTIDGIPFRTTYVPGEGWQVRFNAC